MNIAAIRPMLWKQKGFTLLELVLVLFLIGLLASAGLLFTDNLRDEAQFDETQRRLEVIRKAIIQSGERTVNNQPELSGFVVDNGRLPYCLEELLFVDTTAVSGTNYISPCDSDLTVPQPGTTDEGIRYGWWGPYIQVQPDRDGVRRFRDGYENGVDPTDPNFGWEWTLSESATAVDVSTYDPSAGIPPRPFDLTVRSSGFDVIDPVDDYPQALTDYLLVADDWLAAEAYTVRFYNTSAASSVIGTPDLGDWSLTLANSASNFTSTAFTVATSAIPAVDDGDNSVDETATFSERIPAGHYLVTVKCEADCVTDDVSNQYRIMLLPRQQLAPIRWNVKPQ